MYLAFKHLQIGSKKVNSGQKAKSKVRIIFSKLKCNEIGAVDVIPIQTAKIRTNKVFRSNQITNKVPSNRFRGLKVIRKVRLMF